MFFNKICNDICIFEKNVVLLQPMKHIRIISPASAIREDYVTDAKARLESWGYRVSIGAHALGQHGRFSGTEAERLEDLNAAFADEEVDILLCSRGGYGLQQIVDKIVLPTREKEDWPLVVGFSDITVLHALMSINGVPSLHAPMCKAIATLPEDSPALQGLREALEEGVSSELNVIGGNLSVLYGLQGTPYSLNEMIDRCAEPPALLLEDIDEQHYHIDRMLHNLRMSGVLSRIRGVIVGHFTNCPDDPRMGCSLEETIKSHFAEYGYPIIFGAPYGHEDLNLPVYLSCNRLRK